MKKDKKLIIRWDNSPHWKNISTFPHHKHVGSVMNVVDSREITLEKVLFTINEMIEGSPGRSSMTVNEREVKYHSKKLRKKS